MLTHSWMVLIHILLLVFWLGTDLGVFQAAKMSERSDLSVETRGSLMQLGMVLDRLPRTAVILMLPSGFTLANNLGMVQLSSPMFLGIWLGAFAWAALMWMGFLKPQSKVEALAHKVNFALHIILVAVLAYVIVALWGGTPLWLSMKLLAITLVLVCGIALDVMFRPAVVAFTDIMTNGATPQRDAVYSKAIAPVYWCVIGIYIFVLMATYFGVVKPA